MKILAIGDVVGSEACKFLRSKLYTLKQTKNIDLVIANGENCADGNGVTPAGADFLFESGVDIITLGNHTFRRPEFYSYLESKHGIIRPANFPEGTVGDGYIIYDMGRTSVCVINLIGQTYLDAFDCPFRKLDEILAKENMPKIVLVDFHAEASGEKRAMGFYADGRVSAFFGTHTHVPTADLCILPNGTGYITDIGMTGAIDSVLGVKPELIIKYLKTKLPVRFENQQGSQKMDCVIFEIDEKTGKTIKAERLTIK